MNDNEEDESLDEEPEPLPSFDEDDEIEKELRCAITTVVGPEEPDAEPDLEEGEIHERQLSNGSALYTKDKPEPEPLALPGGWTLVSTGNGEDLQLSDQSGAPVVILEHHPGQRQIGLLVEAFMTSQQNGIAAAKLAENQRIQKVFNLMQQLVALG